MLLPTSFQIHAGPPEPTELKSRPQQASRRWLSWFAVVLAWAAYLVRDAFAAQWTEEVFHTAIEESVTESAVAAKGAAARLRELGHLQLSVSDCDGAEKLFSRAEALLDNSSAVGFPELGALRGERGFALVCARRFHEGAELLREVLQEQLRIRTSAAEEEDQISGPVHLMNALSFAYFYMGDFRRAQSVLERVLELYPDNPLVLNNVGAVHLALGNIPDAQQALHAALVRVVRLTGASATYYQQLVSNNIHMQRRHEQGDTSQAPVLEIFNCMATDVSEMVSRTPAGQLARQYKALETDATAAGVDASAVVETRKAVLYMEREYLLCP
mmetsp:Transcript_44637/g.103997  ORF Transcript_44637/g.103997 Transcript_44637/m.103997 type:complete len:329 (-) Transcript_44637:67-1053(-)